MAHLIEDTDEKLVSHLGFRGLQFIGTSNAMMDTCTYIFCDSIQIYKKTLLVERQPGNLDYALTRSAAIYLESVHNIVIQHCTLQKLQGNGIMLYGRSEHVKISSNDIFDIAMDGIHVIPRHVFRYNTNRNIVGSKMSYSSFTNVSYNRIFAYGIRRNQSVAINLHANSQGTQTGNLIFALPSNREPIQLLNPGISIKSYHLKLTYIHQTGSRIAYH